MDSYTKVNQKQQLSSYFLINGNQDWFTRKGCASLNDYMRIEEQR